MRAALVIVAIIVAASFGYVAYRNAVAGLQHAVGTYAAKVNV